MTCDCCGGTFVDEVGLMIIEDAVLTFRAELRAKQTRDEASWAKAMANVQSAVEGAT